MNVINSYFNYSQLAMATYAGLNTEMNGNNAFITALINEADMSELQAELFASAYAIRDQEPNDPTSGFSATVFSRGQGEDEEVILAIRGSAPLFGDDTLTEKINDWYGTNIGDISGGGIAIRQAIDLFNYIQIQTARAGETVYQYAYHPANEFPSELGEVIPGNQWGQTHCCPTNFSTIINVVSAGRYCALQGQFSPILNGAATAIDLYLVVCRILGGVESIHVSTAPQTH